ncbi:MAG: hypothetical protein K8R40_01140 [Anaerolineaceae bacterium]|nr:hypothetical protein [Anaerolineaceae bacterium]
MPLVLVHVKNEESVLGEVDEMPNPNDTLIIIKNPRRRDGKDVHYLDIAVTTVIYPYERINFVELLPGAEEEEIVSFIRE